MSIISMLDVRDKGAYVPPSGMGLAAPATHVTQQSALKPSLFGTNIDPGQEAHFLQIYPPDVFPHFYTDPPAPAEGRVRTFGETAASDWVTPTSLAATAIALRRVLPLQGLVGTIQNAPLGAIWRTTSEFVTNVVFGAPAPAGVSAATAGALTSASVIEAARAAGLSKDAFFELAKNSKNAREFGRALRDAGVSVESGRLHISPKDTRKILGSLWKDARAGGNLIARHFERPRLNRFLALRGAEMGITAITDNTRVRQANEGILEEARLQLLGANSTGQQMVGNRAMTANEQVDLEKAVSVIVAGGLSENPTWANTAQIFATSGQDRLNLWDDSLAILGSAVGLSQGIDVEGRLGKIPSMANPELQDLAYTIAGQELQGLNR